MALTRVNENQVNTTSFGFEDPILPLNTKRAGSNTGNVGIIFTRALLQKNGALFWDETEKAFRFCYTDDTGYGLDSTADDANAPLIASNILVSTGNFQYAGDARAGIYMMRNTTTGTALTQLYVDGASQQLIVTNNSVWNYEALIIAKRTDTGGHGGAFKITGAVGKDLTAASVFMIGVPSVSIIGRTNGTWHVEAGTDSATGALTIKVSGSLGNTVAWVAKITTTEVTY